MDYSTAFAKLCEFVERIRGKYRFQLGNDTQLEKDLRMTGDDADEFMEAFFREFSVDLSGYEFTKYFHQEGFDPIGLSFLIRKIVDLPPITSPVYDLSLSDLTKIILARKWVEPII